MPGLAAVRAEQRLRHEALLYRGRDEYVDRLSAFIREGVAADEPVMVLVTADKIAALRDALGGKARRVSFADMGEIGLNPSRIIPYWRAFAQRHRDAPSLRGIGEPIWAGRSPEELVEAQRHEALINLALADAPVWIMCPYDVGALAPKVIAEAHRSHPTMVTAGRSTESDRYLPAEAIEPFDAPLPPPSADAQAMRFDAADLSALRRWVATAARTAGLDEQRCGDLVLATNEVAANNIRHGGGGGTVRAWTAGERMIVEIEGAGRIADPLAGRHIPIRNENGGYGLWLANHVCDLVQMRVHGDRSVIRLHLAR